MAMNVSVVPTVFPSALTTFVNVSLADRTAIYDNTLFNEPAASVLTKFGSYKWFITSGVFLLTGGWRVIWSILYYFLLQDAPPKGLKRMPTLQSSLPYLGRIHDIDPHAPWHAYRKFLSNPKWGGIVGSQLMGELHIWVSDLNIAKELLVTQAKITSSRPEIAAVPGSDSQGQYLPLLRLDDHWFNQKKFAVTHLTAASNKQYYGYMSHEVKRFAHCLLNDPHDHWSLADRYCGRIASRLGYGSAESAAAHCKNAAEFISQLGPTVSIANMFPFLTFLPEWVIPVSRTIRERRTKEEKHWKGLLEQVRQEMDNGTAHPISYARSYLERKETSDRPWDFDDHYAAYAIGMLVTVAIFTVGNPIRAFFMAMVLHPEWQEKVRQEVESVTGGERVIEVSDSPRLPILRACIRETHRWRPVVPLGVPRLVDEDTEWRGYYIPKGAVIHAVDLSIARNEEQFPDPDSWRPERWLDQEWPTYKEPLTVHPRLMGSSHFGMGKRLCPGIDVTQNEMLIAGTLVALFSYKPIKDAYGNDAPPSPNHWSPDLIGGPLPYKMDVTVRPGKAEKIKEWYEESVALEESGQRIFI